MPIRKYPIFFNDSGLDSDTSDRFLTPGNSDFILNDIMSFVSGQVGSRVNMKGTQQIHDAGTGITYIGHAVDIEREGIIWFLRHSNGNGSIIRISVNDNSVTNIFTNQNFQWSSDLFIIHANVIGDLLYWVEGLDGNEPRSFNIDEAIAFTAGTGGYREFNQEVISAAKRPPIRPPFFVNGSIAQETIVRNISNPSNSTGFNNNLDANVEYRYGAAFITRISSATTIHRVRSATTVRAIDQTTSSVIMTRTFVDEINEVGVSFDLTSRGTIIFTPANTREYRVETTISVQVFDSSNTEITTGVTYDQDRRVVLSRTDNKPNTTNLGSGELGYRNDTTVVNNNIRGKQFKFAYRYIYRDNERSIFSPFSDVIIPQGEESLNGFNNPNSSLNARLDFAIDTGSFLVKKIEIVVRQGALGAWASYQVIDKEQMIIPDSVTVRYRFFNDIAFSVIDQTLVNEVGTSTPQQAVAQEFVPTNELVYGRTREGFDNIITNIDLTLQSAAYTYQSQFSSFTVTADTIERTISGDLHTVTYVVLQIPATPQVNDVYHLTVLDANNATISVDGPDNWTTIIGVDDRDTITNIVDELTTKLEDLGVGVNTDASKAFRWTATGLLEHRIPGTTENVNVGGIQADGTVDLYFPLVHRDVADGEQFVFLGTASGGIYDIDGTNSNKQRTFKEGLRKVGIKYVDRNGRASTIQTDEDAKIYIDRSAPTQTQLNPILSLQYQIKHKPPMWASSYQMVITKNLSELRFFQWGIDNVEFVRRNGQGFILVGINRSIVGNKEIAEKFNLSSYSFTPGDQLRRIGVRANDTGIWNNINDSSFYDILGVEFNDPATREEYAYDQEDNDFRRELVSVRDAEGNVVFQDNSQRLLLQYNGDESTLNTVFRAGMIVEIITPAQEQSEDFFFEVGEKYDIIDAGTISARHSGQTQDQSATDPINTPAIGVIEGDKVWRVRFDQSKSLDFPCVDDNVSDFYTSNDNGLGKVNVENGDAERNVFNAIRHSGRYFDNTNINDLNRFVAGNYQNIDEKFGPITRIIQIGDALKVYQTRKQTSVYIGKSFIKQGDGTDQVMTVDRTFGVVNPSFLDYGCQFPESVLRNERYVYFYDIYSEAFVRDAANGLEPVSRYRMNGYFRNKSRALIASGIENVRVVTGYDNENDLIYVTFIDSVTPANNETVAFHEDSNRWTCFCSFTPNMYARLGSKTYAAQNQLLHLHNSDTANRCNFYGTKYPRQFRVHANAEPQTVKIFYNIAIHTNQNVWSCPTIQIEPSPNYLRGMFSRINQNLFVRQDGVLHADFRRNMLTTSTTQSVADLVNGDQLRGETMAITLSEQSNDETVLHETDIGYSM